jgi:hypothetical protein
MDSVANQAGDPGFTVRSALGDAAMTVEPAGGSRDLYRVTVRAGTGIAATVLVALNQRRIAEFFSAMARDWRGWAGPRELTAHPPGINYSPGVLRLIATADGRGHIQLRVELGAPWISTAGTEAFDTHVGFGDPQDPGAWSAAVLLGLEAGQLDALAAAAADLNHETPTH